MGIRRRKGSILLLLLITIMGITAFSTLSILSTISLQENYHNNTLKKMNIYIPDNEKKGCECRRAECRVSAEFLKRSFPADSFLLTTNEYLLDNTATAVKRKISEIPEPQSRKSPFFGNLYSAVSFNSGKVIVPDIVTQIDRASYNPVVLFIPKESLEGSFGIGRLREIVADNFVLYH